MRIALFALTSVRTGGWVTSLAHLQFGLKAAGHEALVFRVGERTETHGRAWNMGLSYQNVSRSRAAALCGLADAALIVVSTPRRVEDTELLLRYGAGLLIHDPTELKGVGSVLAASKKPILVYRKAMVQHIEDNGAEALHVPAPYARLGTLPPTPVHNAVAHSRIDFDKNTDVIAAANLLLPPEKRIQIYGTENRLYTHHKLSKEAPEWRANYHGEFKGESLHSGTEVAAKGGYVVDMSTIKGDGGGTQATFLEGWDVGRSVVLHKDWLVGDAEKDEVADAATFVDSPEALAQAVAEGPPEKVWKAQQRAAAAILDSHDAVSVASRIEEYLSA